MGLRTASTTRANTRTSTWAAPARSRARVQASTVAPEVITSSHLAPGGSRDPEDTLHILCPFRSRQADLLRGRPDAPERRRHRHVGDGRDGHGERRGLVEPPRPQAPPVQRHRHQGVGVLQQLAARIGHPSAKRWRHVEPVAVFQRMDQRPRHVLKPHRRACPRVGRRIGDRLQRQDARARIIGERSPQPLAIGAGDEVQFRPAGRTQGARIAHRLAAGRTERRQGDVEKRAQARANDASNPRRRGRFLLHPPGGLRGGCELHPIKLLPGGTALNLDP